jgi:hypothetical protein
MNPVSSTTMKIAEKTRIRFNIVLFCYYWDKTNVIKEHLTIQMRVTGVLRQEPYFDKNHTSTRTRAQYQYVGMDYVLRQESQLSMCGTCLQAVSKIKDFDKKGRDVGEVYLNGTLFALIESIIIKGSYGTNKIIIQ